MRPTRLAATLSLAALLALPAFAQDAERIKAELKKKVPEAPVDTVRKVPYAGLYEVVVGGDIYYTDDKASFLLTGSLIDLKTKENVTELRMRQVNAIKWDTLPFDQAIKIVRGNGSRKVALFEDPNCGYCKRMERDMMGVNDITLYVFLYPILSPDSLEKSKAIWCSSDRGKAWLDHMVRDAAVSGDTTCATPLDRILALGKDKRISGTPTLIFENGERIPGAISMVDFEKRLTEAKNPPAPSASAK
jgi:thiol:disulfide interchange protein DsbC